MKLETKLLYTREYKDGACNLLKPEAFPLYTCTAFTANTLSEIKQAYAQGYTYIRTNNPDRDVLLFSHQVWLLSQQQSVHFLKLATM